VDNLAGDCWAAGAHCDVLEAACCSKGAAHLAHCPLRAVTLRGLPTVCQERGASPSPLAFCPPGALLWSPPLPASAGRNAYLQQALDHAQLLCARVFAFPSSFCAIRADLAPSPLILKNLAI